MPGLEKGKGLAGFKAKQTRSGQAVCLGSLYEEEYQLQSDSCEQVPLAQQQILMERLAVCSEKKYRYRFVVSQLCREEIGEYQSYGIVITCLETGEHRALWDISPDGSAVLGFFHRCVDGGVTPDQLLEVSEDFLGSLYSRM